MLYLDAKNDLYVEEGSGCNVVVVRGNKLITPPAGGSILPGVTRLSVLELAAKLGYETEESPITVHEAMEVRWGVMSLGDSGGMLRHGRRSVWQEAGHTTTQRLGVTCLSVLELAAELGYETEEAPITVHEAMEVCDGMRLSGSGGVLGHACGGVGVGIEVR